MLRAVLLILALTLGAAWPAPGRLSVAAGTTFSELASGDVPALPGAVRTLAVPGPSEAGGPDGGSRSAPRRLSSAAIVEPPTGAVSPQLAARAASARATGESYLARAARQALTRAGLVSSPRTAPPSGCLV